MRFLYKIPQSQAQQGFQQSDTRNKIRSSESKKTQKTGVFNFRQAFSVCQIYVFITNLKALKYSFINIC